MMSLWHKRIDDITADDVDQFLQKKHSEGLRLDYKLEPNKIGKPIAALANAFGGLLIFGVSTHQNQPIWPPTGNNASASIDDGFRDSIVQAANALWPPAAVEVSRVLVNPHDSNANLCVVRVPESPDAPHAADDGTRVYIRTGDQSNPIDLAKLDRLEYLLARRKKSELERDDLIARARRRAIHKLPLFNEKVEVPLRWVSAIPLFPWRNLASQSTCQRLIEVFPAGAPIEVQRVPGGAIGIVHEHCHNLGLSSTDQSYGQSGRHPVLMLGAEQKGHYFAFQRVYADGQRSGIRLGPSVRLARTVFATAQHFLNSADVEKPGYLQLTIGIENALELRMFKPYTEAQSDAFPDPQFICQRIIPFDEFSSFVFQEGRIPDFEHELYCELATSFNVDPARQDDWGRA